MFNLLAGDAYCYFNGHYLILKFSECQCVLEGGCDCLADRVPDPVISFPRAPFSTAIALPLPLLLSIYATARLKVQKLFSRTCTRMQGYRMEGNAHRRNNSFSPIEILTPSRSCERTSISLCKRLFLFLRPL